MCAHMFMLVFVHACVWIYASVCGVYLCQGNVCLCVCACVCMLLCACIHVHPCICVYVHLCVCVCVRAYMCARAKLFKHASTYTHTSGRAEMAAMPVQACEDVHSHAQ